MTDPTPLPPTTRTMPASFVEKLARATGILNEGPEIAADLAPPACLHMASLSPDERGNVIAASCGRRDGHPGLHMDMSLDYQWTRQERTARALGIDPSEGRRLRRR